MPAPTSLLDEALNAWAYTRAGVIAEVENLPSDRFAFRPSPESRSVAELVRHIIGAGLMMSGELSRPDGDFRRLMYDDFMREYAGHLNGAASAGELSEALRTAHEDGDRRLREAGEIHMLQRIRQFDGTYATRLSWMSHGISHEEYHRGQLALYGRLLGRVPALTRLIRGEG